MKREDTLEMNTQIDFGNLRDYLRKGMRTGNWRKLSYLEKALYRAALGYARHYRIVNEMLVEKLLEVVARLEETNGTRIFRRGLKKAIAMLEKGEEKGVFAWAPSLRGWLKDRDYIFWLGTLR